MKSEHDDIIEIKLPPLSKAEFDSFKETIQFKTSHSTPPTLFTLFRHGEYSWLKKLGVKSEGLLHADQEYIYKGEYKNELPIIVRTRLSSYKERKGKIESLQFYVFESDIFSGETHSASSKTTFVVKK